MKLTQDLESRGLIKQMTSDKVRDLLDGSSVTFYCGFDPTADSLHVGSLLPLITMLRLKKAGHKPLALLGGATALIGDPSFKKGERSMLDLSTVQKNTLGLKAQMEKILGSVELVNNIDWIGKISLLDFLRDQGKCFTINGMISKESVKERISDPDKSISFTEFSYPLLQGEDFRHLLKEKNCILQVGGSDQWTNILAGVDLVRKMEDKEVFGLTLPLLVKNDGSKFGKSESGNVWLDPSKTSVFDFFQFFTKTADADVMDLLKKMTFLSEEKISSLEFSLKTNPEKREAQRALAEEVTTLVHGKEACLEAISQTEKLFQTVNLHTASVDLELSVEESLHLTIADLLVKTQLSPSKTQARKDMAGGGVRIQDQKILEDRKLLPQETLFILAKGKGSKKVIKIS